MVSNGSKATIREVYEITTRLETKIDNLGDIYVTKDRFRPVERIAYGLVSLIVLTVVGALLTLVVGVGKVIGR